MTKVKMPEPVAWVMPEHIERLTRWNGAINAKNVTLYHNQGERKGTVSLYTADQAEAYANAKVKQALEEAAKVCWLLRCSDEFEPEVQDRLLKQAEGRIRALIPKENE